MKNDVWQKIEAPTDEERSLVERKPGSRMMPRPQRRWGLLWHPDHGTGYGYVELCPEQGQRAVLVAKEPNPGWGTAIAVHHIESEGLEKLRFVPEPEPPAK